MLLLDENRVMDKLVKYIPMYKCRCCGDTFAAEKAIEYHGTFNRESTYELFPTYLKQNLENYGYSPLREELTGSGIFFVHIQLIHVCDCCDVYYGIADLVGFKLKGEENGQETMEHTL